MCPQFHRLCTLNLVNVNLDATRYARRYARRSFDANWDEDGSEDGSEEEEDEEEDDDLALNVSTSRTHSVDTTTPATDSGFKILQLETEMMILKKKLQRKEAQITELEASNSKAEREGYNSQMNVSTLQAELNTSHASISGLEEVKNGQAEEVRGGTEGAKRPRTPRDI